MFGVLHILRLIVSLDTYSIARLIGTAFRVIQTFLVLSNLELRTLDIAAPRRTNLDSRLRGNDEWRRKRAAGNLSFSSSAGERKLMNHFVVSSTATLSRGQNAVKNSPPGIRSIDRWASDEKPHNALCALARCRKWSAKDCPVQIF
jgi:hypothetical protein